MQQSRHLWGAFIGWICCMACGELAAQQLARPYPTRQGQSEIAGVTGRESPAPQQMAHLNGRRHNPPVSESSYIAVIGAVKTPTVFETTERSLPLQTLIERVGGETAESIGTVRILERAVTRYVTSMHGHPDLRITHGQVVFVVPRGGQPARVTNTRQAPPDRFVLISGIAPGPLLFNIGNQSRTFGDLLLLLGQSPEMVSRQQVNATLPHGQWMERDSLLVHNSVIHFHQEAVFADGIREAVDKGFRYESPVKYESTATALPTPIDPSPAKAVPVASPSKLPVIKPQPIYTRPVPVVPTPTPKIGVSSESVNSGIEAAGSTILFDEPMPFPKKTRVELDDEEQSPSVKTNGRTPLMLPKTWPAPEGESLDEKVEDSARILERTSAEYDPEQSHIVTVSAEAAAEERTSSSQPSAPPFEIAGRDTTDSSNSASWFPSPQSWLALIVTVGVAVTSVVVSRRISRDEDSTEADAAPAARADSSVPAPVATRETAHEDEQRFLQRLILNKIPLIEETATLPPVDRLHGLAIGGRRLVVHEAHDGVAGPHFQVRDPSDTRDVELRLRRLLRADRATPKPAPVFVTAAGVQGTRTSRVSPLEKALRTVGRGDAP